MTIDEKTYDPANVAIAWDKSGATLTPADGVRYEALSLLLLADATVTTADALIALMRSVVREEMAGARREAFEHFAAKQGERTCSDPMHTVEHAVSGAGVDLGGPAMCRDCRCPWVAVPL